MVPLLLRNSGDIRIELVTVVLALCFALAAVVRSRDVRLFILFLGLVSSTASLIFCSVATTVPNAGGPDERDAFLRLIDYGRFAGNLSGVLVLIGWAWIAIMKKNPNHPPEPPTTAVTPPAAQEPRQP